MTASLYALRCRDRGVEGSHEGPVWALQPFITSALLGMATPCLGIPFNLLPGYLSHFMDQVKVVCQGDPDPEFRSLRGD